jgi:hypothetical protein
MSGVPHKLGTLALSRDLELEGDRDVAGDDRIDAATRRQATIVRREPGLRRSALPST